MWRVNPDFIRALQRGPLMNTKAPNNPPTGGTSGQNPNDSLKSSTSSPADSVTLHIKGTDLKTIAESIFPHFHVNSKASELQQPSIDQPLLNKEFLAAYQINIVTSGYEEDIAYQYFLVKNITVGFEGNLKFFTLLHNKRIDKNQAPESEDYPQIGPKESLTDYLARVEKLSFYEWQMVEFQDHIQMMLRGRTVFEYGENAEYKFLHGDRLSIAQKTEDDNTGSVVTLRKP